MKESYIPIFAISGITRSLLFLNKWWVAWASHSSNKLLKVTNFQWIKLFSVCGLLFAYGQNILVWKLRPSIPIIWSAESSLKLSHLTKWSMNIQKIILINSIRQLWQKSNLCQTWCLTGIHRKVVTYRLDRWVKRQWRLLAHWSLWVSCTNVSTKHKAVQCSALPVHCTA